MKRGEREREKKKKVSESEKMWKGELIYSIYIQITFEYNICENKLT